MNAEDSYVFEALIEGFNDGLRSIARGGIDGPGGLEALAMSIGGEYPWRSGGLAAAVREGFQCLAEAITSGEIHITVNHVTKEK